MATTTINLTNGTFVYQGYPTQAYGQSESYYRVGTATQSTWRARSLINVPLGEIPAGAIINSAKLRLYAGNSSISSAASSLTITFYARRITSSWTNSATWNDQPSATTTGQGSVTGSGWNNTLYELDVKTIVQAWVNGTTNHGLILIQDSASLSTTKVFPKSTAVLVVDYTEPTATVTKFDNFSSEAANIGFTVSNPGGGTLSAALKIGSATIFTGVSVTAASGAKSITLSTAYKNAIYDALGDSVSGTATLTLSTTIGGVTRTHSATATVSIPTSVVPTLTTAVSGATAAGANGVTAKSYAIQNVGVINGTSTATAPRGTTIKSYRWTLAGGSTKTTKDVSWVPTVGGTLEVICEVTDGRERPAAVSKNITVTPYTPPTLKMTRVERVTVDLNKVDVTYTPTVDAIGDTNRWRLVIRTRPVGGSWSTAYDSGVIANGTSGSKTSRLTPTYSTTQSYELEATLTDGYNTRSGSLMIPTEAVPLAIGRDGIGIGKIPEAGRALDVQGDTYFDGVKADVGKIGRSSGQIIRSANDPDWRNANDFEFYYLGGVGITLGYPIDWGLLLSWRHDALIWQIVTSADGLMWNRRIIPSTGEYLPFTRVGITDLTSSLTFEPWKNAVLQNGWSGTLNYSKSGLGLVKFTGDLVSPSEVTDRQVIATLPLGYRPLVDTPFIAYESSKGRILLFGTITTTGLICLELQLPGDVQVAEPSKGYKFNVIFSIDN